MVRPSNPRLMAQVLEAVKHLGEGRGSSVRQVLDLVRQGKNAPSRNLAMQVRRALKNAVTAGLLQLRSGRYKMLIPLQTSASKSQKVKKGTGSKTNSSSVVKKKEDLENAMDSESPQPLDPGPRRRCSHCKKHKRRSSKRRRKRTPKRRRRSTKQAKERNSRKLRRRGRGDDEVSNRRERRRKISSPGTRQNEVPNNQRTDKTGKTNPDNNQDSETRESVIRNRSVSSSDSEGGEEVPNTTRAKLSSAGRKTRRNSRKRNSSSHCNISQHGGSHHLMENDSEDVRMDCREEIGQQSQNTGEAEGNVCEDNSRSGTSL